MGEKGSLIKHVRQDTYRQQQCYSIYTSKYYISLHAQTPRPICNWSLLSDTYYNATEYTQWIYMERKELLAGWAFSTMVDITVNAMMAVSTSCFSCERDTKRISYISTTRLEIGRCTVSFLGFPQFRFVILK